MSPIADCLLERVEDRHLPVGSRCRVEYAVDAKRAALRDARVTEALEVPSSHSVAHIRRFNALLMIAVEEHAADQQDQKKDSSDDQQHHPEN